MAGLPRALTARGVVPRAARFACALGFRLMEWVEWGFSRRSGRRKGSRESAGRSPTDQNKSPKYPTQSRMDRTYTVLLVARFLCPARHSVGPQTRMKHHSCQASIHVRKRGFSLQKPHFSHTGRCDFPTPARRLGTRPHTFRPSSPRRPPTLSQPPLSGYETRPLPHHALNNPPELGPTRLVD